MANYHILKIDSLIESLTLCNSQSGFKFQFDFVEDIVTYPGDMILGYLNSPINEVRYIFEVISAKDDAIVMIKRCEVSEGVHIDLSTIPELQPIAYTNEFMTIAVETFTKITRKLLDAAFERDSVKKSRNITTKTEQTIYYGCPGTGKSFKVKNTVLAEINDECIFRTTFHPDSDYASFIGTYKPITTQNIKIHTKQYSFHDLALMLADYYNNSNIKSVSLHSFILKYIDYFNGNIEKFNTSEFFQAAGLSPSYVTEANKMINLYDWLKNNGYLQESCSITYKFEPQVFTNAYIKAWQNPEKQVFLVIEEINRGNCAQIFGDLFQLLDRKDGISEYPVKADAALTQYLKEVLTGDAAQGIEGDMLRLPSNLNIIATMNTSDQSLFPMDSAFKRRWDWKYIPTLPPINEDKSFDLHFDSETISIDGKNIDAGDYEYSWTDFLKKINEKIFTATHSEDKLLGFWFVKTENPTNEIPISTFVSKVVFYLWNDVFKDLGPKGSNPFTIQKDGKSEVMHYNTFFEYNAKGEIVENMGVLHTFLRNVGLTPEPKKEIINAQEADILQHDASI